MTHDLYTLAKHKDTKKPNRIFACLHCVYRIELVRAMR